MYYAQTHTPRMFRENANYGLFLFRKLTDFGEKIKKSNEHEL